MNWIYMVILVKLISVSLSVNPNYSSVEKKLIRNLLNRYKKFGVIGRPVNDTDRQLHVKYGLALIQILGLEENKQILRTNCWSRYTWFDVLLKWDPTEYNQIKQIRVFPHEIWTPDIKLYNFADERLTEFREARVVIRNDGEVLWVPQALFKSTCSVNILYFPFDIQTCSLAFGSWTYDSTQIYLDWWYKTYNSTTLPVPYVDFTDYVDSNEWITDGQMDKDLIPIERKKQIKSVKKNRSMTERNHLGENVTRYFHILEYRIRMRRNYIFHVFILVIPCLLLSCLTLVLFWLPPESPAKMMLGMNIFVAFFILLHLLAESTPSSVKNFPLIGAYFCLNMILITLSTFLAVFVLNLYFRGDSKGRVPSIVRRLFIDGLGRLIMAGQQEVSTIHQGILFTMNIGGGPNKGNNNNNKSATNVNGGDATSKGPFQLNNTAFRSRLCKKLNNTANSNNKNESNSLEQPATTAQTDKSSNENSATNIGSKELNLLERDIADIKNFVQEFVNRQKQHTMKSIVSQEWRSLALIIDRLFFCLYVTAILVALIILVTYDENPDLN